MIMNKVIVNVCIVFLFFFKHNCLLKLGKYLEIELLGVCYVLRNFQAVHILILSMFPPAALESSGSLLPSSALGYLSFLPLFK